MTLWEQALNTKTADARADIYALGCSLYYLLSGKATYDGDTLMAKLLAHLDQPIPDLRAINPQVSTELDSVFKRMVAKKLEDRYQTMTAVIADLERCETGQPVNPLSSAASTTGLSSFLQHVEDTRIESRTMLRQKKPVTVQPLPGWRDFFRDKRNLRIGGGLLSLLLFLAGGWIDADVPVGRVDQMVRQALVQAARLRATRTSGKPNKSLIAAITGIPRSEVSRLLVNGRDATEQALSTSRAQKLLRGWRLRGRRDGGCRGTADRR